MKRHLFIIVFLALPFIFGLSSCASVITGIYGIKKTKVIDEKTIIRYSKKYNIPITDSYELDTAYCSYLFSLDTVKHYSQIKNHYQPLQALYYDKTGLLKSFQVNCYAGGFPNLNWNGNDIMTTFPPKQQAPIDSIVTLETHMNYLKPLLKPSNIDLENYDYLVIVYWNRFMGRQSKRLIHAVQENSKLEKEKKIKIIYVNNDNIFAEQ